MRQFCLCASKESPMSVVETAEKCGGLYSPTDQGHTDAYQTRKPLRGDRSAAFSIKMQQGPPVQTMIEAPTAG